MSRRVWAIAAALSMMIAQQITASTTAAESKRMIRLEVSGSTDEGVAPLGTIEFSDGRATLKLIRDDSAGQRLRQAWNEIRGRQAIPMRETRKRDGAGGQIRAYGTRLVSPGEKDFPWAVYDYLEYQYNFTVDVKD